ncbi:MAG: helix-turn-helix transcriptional regulator [Erysipelothrix sp.]|nr:helix-turn-helix transcriptional regulator [Erysipelothrix sp.]
MINKIREFRELRAMTQIDLAALVNVSRQTIISLEKGSYNPSLELAFKIAQALNVSIEEIFRMEDSYEVL